MLHSSFPIFSKNISKIKPSLTLSLNAKAGEMLKAGKPVISLAVGEPDFPTPKIIVDQAIKSLTQGRTKYGAAGGGLELRKGIAEKLIRENTFKYQPDEIVVGMGVKEILFHLMLSLLNPGDEVLILSPYWVSYADQVIAAGGTPIFVPIPENFPYFFIDPALIRAYATAKTVALILNSPNNPSGYVLGELELKKLGELLRQTNWWIISDEIYEYLSFEFPHLSLLQVCPELRDRFILVNGFSKGFAMTGWRVGYAAGPKSVIRMVQALQSHSSTCLPGFIEDAACVAIKGGLALMQPQMNLLNERRRLAIEALKKLPMLIFNEPLGAFYVFLDVRNILKKLKKDLESHLKSKVSDKVSSLEFSNYLLNQHCLVVVPGEAFGASGFLRLSYSVHQSVLLEGIERMKTAFYDACV